MTDHNVKSTLEIVDRAYIIFEGKVLFKGRPDEIIKNKNVRTFYLGNDFWSSQTRYLFQENKQK